MYWIALKKRCGGSQRKKIRKNVIDAASGGWFDKGVFCIEAIVHKGAVIYREGTTVVDPAASRCIVVTHSAVAHSKDTTVIDPASGAANMVANIFGIVIAHNAIV